MVTSCCRLFGTVFCLQCASSCNWPLAAVIVQGSHDCPSALVADLEEFIIFGSVIQSPQWRLRARPLVTAN